MAQTSIPGGSGSTITFNVTGGAAANYASDFANAVANAAVISNLSNGDSESTVPGALNVIGASSTTTYSLATSGQYTYASVENPTTIEGSSGGGDTVLAGGGVSYIVAGGDDNVAFIDGNNVFYGSSASGQTISGGSGSDILNTGTGSSTVFSGSGHTLINLSDSVGGDIAVMVDGNSTVNAFGVHDTVYASSAIAATTGTIFGGAGTLTFVAGNSVNPMAVTIDAGSGTADMFGGAGSQIVFANTSGHAVFVAGAGVEHFNGFNALAGFAAFGDTVAADAASIHDTLVGGAGNDFFSTGGGQETIFAGTGAALFHIDDLRAGTNITIADFNANDSVNFGGLTVAEETSLLGTASTVAGGNLSVTLQNGTQVEFIAVTSLTGHLV